MFSQIKPRAFTLFIDAQVTEEQSQDYQNDERQYDCENRSEDNALELDPNLPSPAHIRSGEVRNEQPTGQCPPGSSNPVNTKDIERIVIANCRL